VNVLFGPNEAKVLGEQAARLEMSARELALFGEQDPGLAGECGVEVNALEARTILSGGVCRRLAGLAAESVRSGKPVPVAANDLDMLGRLDEVVALGNGRIGLKIAAIDAEKGQEGAARLGSIIGLATGAVGLVKSIF
jgi:hypothetical protein